MAYELLSKTYYKNRSGYEQEYLTRFNSLSASHLNFLIHGNPAFFIQTEEMVSLLYQILLTDKQVTQVKTKLPGQAIQQYYVKSLIEEIHQSLNIEQINSTRKEISETRKKQKEDRLLGMITRYDALLTQEPIALQSCADIRQLYDEICLPEVKKENPDNIPDGEWYRKQPVQVYSSTDKVIHTGLFPESAIINAMDQALSILQDESINILYRTAIFHYLFGYIHPFYDGNGRLARFISSYMLSHTLDPLIGVRISYTINEGRTKYYTMFKEGNDPKNKGDLTPFIIGFLQILSTAYLRLHEALESRVERMKRCEQTIDQILTEKKQQLIAFLLLQVSLFASEGITLPEIVQNTSVGYTTVKRFLDSKIGRTMLPATKDGKRKLYKLDLEWLDQQIQ
ncbi:MAG TPA: Fic family protein [Candidatus Limiplasma sp.]|nr:Fic family protein [Candidatus Limiplasma sp.]HRX07830.1 Fic family protein [Candidatus Limiplasma sp.]